jgi:hypothetical protein
MEEWKTCVATLSLGKTSDVRMSRRGSEDGGGEREWRANWTVDLNRKKIDFAMFDRVYTGENVGSQLGLLVDCFTEVRGIGGNSR